MGKASLRGRTGQRTRGPRTHGPGPVHDRGDIGRQELGPPTGGAGVAPVEVPSLAGRAFVRDQAREVAQDGIATLGIRSTLRSKIGMKLE